MSSCCHTIDEPGFKTCSKCRARCRAWYEAHTEQRKTQIKEYQHTHRATETARRRAYYQTNTEKESTRIATRQLERRATDLNYRLSGNLRARLLRAILTEAKTGSAVRDLGCSIPKLKAHLEARFEPGMTWENYGTWHIDHIRPLALFDLTDRAQLLEVCHYTNLQPLWAKDNLAKSKSVSPS